MATFAKAGFDSARYLRYRPQYTSQLYSALLEYHHGSTGTALDCGAGTCQVAGALASRFTNVQATDPSERMVSEAPKGLPNNVKVSVASAERLPFPTGSADLIVAGQAAHWFDIPRFFAEAHRVLKPDGKGTVAVWGYTLLQFPKRESITKRVHAFCYGTGEGQMGEYWEGKRAVLDSKYSGFEDAAREAGFVDVERWDYPLSGTFVSEHNPPNWPRQYDAVKKSVQIIERDLSLNGLKDYLSTFSAYKNYVDKHAGAPDALDAFIETTAKEEGITDRDEVWETQWPGVVIIARTK
ncbi:S-adenosyl-L-methionine-dependent methyltransferase [Fimicolochytrium jonesii]|uniref:S-adenosyl-L-methionine-dependent methyltransferase n=1 Tax=Fimicolochytrium jonesii TaxID=1396493 RepID=UPI0022FDF451|nr:S-adenosyl-L-methionine-dependent methyltransferase [Fimicolochytrium jonesii]KAI8817191.1 S-adenosyl-L-methionine-dependent methyltransferase [Fimicolochytrium jonesii]